MKLQTILYPTEKICKEEALYLHKEEGLVHFDGYFNLFYLEKHHKYCDIDTLSLELEVSGIKGLRIMHDNDLLQEIRAEGRVSIPMPYEEYGTGVFWFGVEPEETGREWSVKGHYEGSTGAGGQVELAVNICTFKREPYVVRNMKSLLEWKNSTDIDGRKPEVAEHMHVFIVDNAKTLLEDQAFLDATGEYLGDGSRSLIRVIPNSNTGGAGGFGRGMVEAIDKREELGLTHLLMMDDDAVFDPEVFIRLYGFLGALKEDYQGITVGGALMREDFPYIQHAAGEWYSRYLVNNDHPLADMREFGTCTRDWVCGTEEEGKVYGAWWCCCYHMSAITRENLPLPIFVHHDDIQFGLEQQKLGRKIVFLNGVCVWHQGFELVFPGVKQYYDMRNALITSAMYEPDYLKKTVRKWVIKRYVVMLASYRYGDCEFIYRGLMDFLKGRQWLLESDPEAIHKDLMATYKRMCPFEKMEAEAGVRNSDGGSLTPERLRSYYSQENRERNLLKKITLNGWFLPADDELQVITPVDSPWLAYRHRRVLLFEPGTGKGCETRRRNRELFRGLWRIIRMSAAIGIWKLGGGKW